MLFLLIKKKSKSEQSKSKRKKNENGYIYLIKDEGSGLVKVGYSKNPSKRLKALQTSSPSTLKLLATKEGNYTTESKFHKAYQKDHIRGEWYRLSPQIMEDWDLKA